MNTKSRMYMQMKNNFLIGAAVGGIIAYLLFRKKNITMNIKCIPFQ